MERGRSTWYHNVPVDSTGGPDMEDAASYAVEGGSLPSKEKRGKSKKKLELTKALSLDEAQRKIQQQNLSKQAPIRSQTFDSSKSLERNEGSSTQSSFIKHNKTFHKLFQDIPENEDLIHAFVCALQKEVPYHGRLYVSENHVCFHSSVLLKDTKVVIPVSKIHILKKQNTVLLVPNALSIRTKEGEKYLFVSLRNREVCYKLLCSICPHTEEGSTNSSPVFSSADNSFDQYRLETSSQSSVEDSFDQLNSRALLQSSSPKLTRVPYGSRSTHREQTLRENKDATANDLSANGLWFWTAADRVRSLVVQRDSSRLSVLLFIYLILALLLLLSSGYIGLRIVALEEQLTSLGALPEFSLPTEWKDT
uniref:Si:zfos-943e10.1 n=1 Tax=Scleropages formosus TaxID=113540 RepID=A0A8C9S449_SCLFO